MNCFLDHIGVLWCGATNAPPSGLYINSLPGISFKQMMSLADSEQKTFEGVWSDIQTRAIKRFELDIKQKLNKRFKISNINQSITIPLSSTGNIVSVSDTGLKIKLNCNNDTQFKTSALQDIFIQSFYIWSENNNIDGTAEITDETEVVLWSTDITLLSGNNKIQVNKSITELILSSATDYLNNRTISITFLPLSAYQPFETRVIEFNNLGWCCCCDGEILGVYDNGTDLGQSSYGVGVILSDGCTWNKLVCTNKNIFTTAFWYLLGIELMNEQLYSERLNEFTTISLKKAKELKAMYEVHYMGGTLNDLQFDGALTQAVDGINIDSSDCCLECNEQLQIKEVCI